MGLINESDCENNNSIIVKGGNLNFKPDPNGVGCWFFRSMNLHRHAIAQRDGLTGVKENYENLLERCTNAAIEMRNRGITEEDVISICSLNHLNSCVPFVSTMFLGAKLASLDPMLPLSDTVHLIKLVNPKLIFVGLESVELIENALKETNTTSTIVVFGPSTTHAEFCDFIAPKNSPIFTPVIVEDIDRTALIHFSSGTTGMPKGICISHNTLMAQVNTVINNAGFDFSVTFSYASFYWISTSTLFTACMLSGGSRLIVPRYSIDTFWKLISQFRVTVLFVAPSQAVAFCKYGRPEGINTLQLANLLIGGGPISAENLNGVRDIFPGTYVLNVYGQTEVCGLCFVFNRKIRSHVLLMYSKPASTGKPIPGFDYKIVDPETEEILGPNQRGELRIKTKIQLHEYYRQDSSNIWDEDGWLKTGDCAYYDDDECFFIVDRLKEMLKFQAYHVPPAVIEGVLLTHPAVQGAIVVGIPDEIDGDHPVAAIVLKDPDDAINPKEFIKFVEERLDDRYRLRGGVRILTQLPATATGKYKRKEVRDIVMSTNLTFL